jgi:hypothetical protein
MKTDAANSDDWLGQGEDEALKSGMIFIQKLEML